MPSLARSYMDYVIKWASLKRTSGSFLHWKIYNRKGQSTLPKTQQFQASIDIYIKGRTREGAISSHLKLKSCRPEASACELGLQYLDSTI